MTRATKLTLAAIALMLVQPLSAAPPDPPARQIPARDAGFGNVRQFPAITPEDIARRQIEDARTRDDGHGLRQGRDVPTPEEARDLQRRAADERQRATEFDRFRREESQRRQDDLSRFRNEESNRRQDDMARLRTEQQQLRMNDREAAAAAAAREAQDRSRQRWQQASDRGLAAANIALQLWRVLHASDHTCLANTSPRGMPLVPSKCAGSEACTQCYGEAYSRLNRSRGNLEKLRCIYNWNKQYSERATSFGDNVSSIHGISGLAWQQERRRIEKAVDEMGVAYDAKYRELLKFVRDDIGEISACEARFFGNDDWGTRYGFMFYGFLEDRYRR